jgi:hypothetical protein
MRLYELIERLQEIAKEHGDHLEVHKDDDGRNPPIVEVSTPNYGKRIVLLD